MSLKKTAEVACGLYIKMGIEGCHLFQRNNIMFYCVPIKDIKRFFTTKIVTLVQREFAVPPGKKIYDNKKTYC